ncbi:hypothetical protein AB205_0203110, partial [Aquarana catesbeiana]
MRAYNSTERIRVRNDPVMPDYSDQRSYVIFYMGLACMIFASGLAPHFAMTSMQDMK